MKIAIVTSITAVSLLAAPASQANEIANQIRSHVEAKVDQFAETLNLGEDKTTQVKEIVNRTMDKRTAAREKLDQEKTDQKFRKAIIARHEMKKITNEADKELEQVLTPGQLELFKGMRMQSKKEIVKFLVNAEWPQS